MIWPFSKRSCSRCKEVEAGLVRLKSIDYKADVDDGMVLNAAFEGAAVKLFAAAAVHWFYETGGQNFVTMNVDDPRTGQAFTLTMQKAGGKTPSDRIAELQAQLSANGSGDANA